MKLEWDYSNIGDISEYVVENSSEYINGFYISKLKFSSESNEIAVVIEPFENIAIACDKIKTYFGLFAFGYHICYIGEVKYMIREYHFDIPLSEKYPKLSSSFSDELFINEVKRCLAFQWMAGFGSFNPSQIVVREHPLIGLYPVVRHQRYRRFKGQNDKLVKAWFDNLINLYQEVLNFVNRRNSSKISMEIRDILLKDSPQEIQWKEYILDRISIAKR